jgi:hypothetical protein
MKILFSIFLVGICNAEYQRQRKSYLYGLRHVYDNTNYLDMFTFMDSDDRSMSHGSVRSVNVERFSYHSDGQYSWKDKKYALQNGLVSSRTSAFRVGAGREVIGDKRASVKLEGVHTYDAKSLFVFDVAHMPEADCGSWPALWTMGRRLDGQAQWPKHGEIGS